MNWDDLRIFLAISRTQTLSGAARRLGVSHTTVSRRLTAFEDQLDVRLFERLPEGLILTDAGKELRTTALRIEGEIKSAERFLVGRDKDVAGPLLISMPFLLLTGWMFPHLQAYSEAFPDVEVQMMLSGQHMSLSRREVDIALRLTNNPPESAVGKCFSAMSAAVYASKSYLAKFPPDVDLNTLQWIGLEPAEHDFDSDFIQEHLPGIKVLWRLSEFSLVHTALQMGVGISRLPCIVGELDPQLTRVKGLPIVSSLDFWLLTHRDIRHTARVRSFLDFISERISSDLRVLDKLLENEKIHPT